MLVGCIVLVRLAHPQPLFVMCMTPYFNRFFLLLQAVFFGLLNDLFPSINPPRLVNDSLNECVREVCEDMNLWPDEAFVLKVSWFSVFFSS